MDQLSSLLVRRLAGRNAARYPFRPQLHVDEVFAPYGLSHLLILNEKHWGRVLQAFIEYYKLGNPFLPFPTGQWPPHIQRSSQNCSSWTDCPRCWCAVPVSETPLTVLYSLDSTRMRFLHLTGCYPPAGLISGIVRRENALLSAIAATRIT
jgi:hypothetical protein